jgi:hypothetical protein
VVCDETQEDVFAVLTDTAIDKFGWINIVALFAGIIMDGLILSTGRKTRKVKRKMPLDTFQKRLISISPEYSSPFESA